MNCFTHQNIPAVCACGTCLKGLCQNCMQHSNDKFVCSQACAEYLEKITKLNKYAMSIYGIDKNEGSRKLGFRTAMLHLALGVSFLGLGVYSLVHFSDWGLTCFALAAGLIFSVQGYKTYKRGLKL